MEKHTFKFIIASLLILILCFFQTCGTKGKINDVKKQNEALDKKIDSLQTIISKQQDFDSDAVEYKMEQTMYKFLIYEEDLDKGRISLSEIKNRIDE